MAPTLQAQEKFIATGVTESDCIKRINYLFSYETVGYQIVCFLSALQVRHLSVKILTSCLTPCYRLISDW